MKKKEPITEAETEEENVNKEKIVEKSEEKPETKAENKKKKGFFSKLFDRGDKEKNDDEEVEEVVEKSEAGPEKALVSNAIADLKKELYILRKERKGLKESLEDARGRIKSDQNKELELRGHISVLTKRESYLSAKRIRIEEKLDKLKEKLAKISRISRELEGVEETPAAL